jgi:hypothetical protein
VGLWYDCGMTGYGLDGCLGPLFRCMVRELYFDGMKRTKGVIVIQH